MDPICIGDGNKPAREFPFSMTAEAIAVEESLVATCLLDVLRHRPYSKTELHAVLHNHTPARRLDAELEGLIARGLVAADMEKTGGRSRTTYRIAETIKGSPLATSTL